VLSLLNAVSKSTRFRPLAALAALFNPPPPTLSADGLLDIHRAVLPNGLRVWVKPRRGTATVYLVLMVRVGSRHETEANNGISHFLEHMLFTGTPQWGEADVMEVVRRRGGHANARTTREDTAFWLHLQASDLDFGLDWLTEVVLRSNLPEDKFKKERNIIIQEKGGNVGRFDALFEWLEDRGLGWNVFRAVRHRLFPESSLLLPVIGDDASLGRITYPQVTEFYRTHYLPNNMTLIVVGDVRPEEVVERAARVLSGFPAGELPARPVTPPPPEGGFNVRLHGPNINEQGQILLGAPLPGMDHPDRWALGVLAEILDTRLTRDIRYRRGLVYGIDVYPALYTDCGYFVVYTTADSEKFDEILEEVERQIENAIQGELAAAEVDEAKTAIRGRWLLGMEGNADFAWWLAEMSLFTPEGRPLPDAFAELAAVTAADVKRVAQAYLSSEKRYQAIHRPGLTPARMVRPAAAALGLALAGLGAWLLARGRRDPNRIDRTRSGG
jgi:predicted Zn-dependent peptidase